MAKQHKKEVKETNSSTTITTKLPGLRDVEVIVSQPSLVKENSSEVTKK